MTFQLSAIILNVDWELAVDDEENASLVGAEGTVYIGYHVGHPVYMDVRADEGKIVITLIGDHHTETWELNQEPT